MKQVQLHHGAATDVGRVREVNEDAYLASPPVFVVADGMGGHAGGDVASAIVVEEFGRLAEEGYDPQRGTGAVAATVQAAQERIVEFGAAQRARGVPGRFQAGTTVAAALLVEDGGEPAWLLANLGDSRIYRFAHGALEQVSVDHSVVQELLDAGSIAAEDASHHPERHVITRALGDPDGVEADYFRLPLSAVERLLLCTDGVTGMIDDDAIARVLTEVADPRDAAAALVAEAVAAGGMDNATAVVVDVVGLVTEGDDDAERGQVGLAEKPGALP